MSEHTTYPTLDEGSIKMILRFLSDDPSYLKHPNCPYTDDTKALFTGPSSTDSEGIVNNIDRQIGVLDTLNKQLEKQSDRFDNGELEPSEANAYFRQRISVAREILELQERLSYVRNVDSFFGKVLEIMEDNMDADQRASVIKELEQVMEKED